MQHPLIVKAFGLYGKFFRKFHANGKRRNFDEQALSLMLFVVTHFVIAIVSFAILGMVLTASSTVTIVFFGIVAIIYAIFEYYNQIGD